MMTQSASSHTYTGHGNRRRRGSWFRPAWTPPMIALMVGGFIVAWPVGLALMAYIIWGDRMDDIKHEFRRGWSRFRRDMDMGGRTVDTGNVAFDEFREAELKRLEEERRKLDGMVDEFDAYLRNLRRAKDQEEFDAFMKARHNHNGDHPTNDAGPSTGQQPPAM